MLAWNALIRRPVFPTLFLSFFLLLSPSFAQQQPAPASPPEMHALLLGTGYPRPNPAHAGPSTAVIVGDEVFVVDAGRSTARQFVAAGLPWKQIRAVFLTHLHSDHIDGLPDLFHSAWQFGKPAHAFQLYGPEGTNDLATGLLKFYGHDIHIRRDLTEMLPPEGAKISVHIVKEGLVYEDEDVRVTAFLVDHWPVVPAFGYRFESRGKSIVISGDTHPNDNLVRFAKGADVLIHEAYYPPERPDNEAWFSRYHSSAEEAGQDAARAGVKVLVLTHLIPNRPDLEPKFLQDAAKAFHGTILVGRELMRIDPPALHP